MEIDLKRNAAVVCRFAISAGAMSYSRILVMAVGVQAAALG